MVLGADLFSLRSGAILPWWGRASSIPAAQKQPHGLGWAGQSPGQAPITLGRVHAALARTEPEPVVGVKLMLTLGPLIVFDSCPDTTGRSDGPLIPESLPPSTEGKRRKMRNKFSGRLPSSLQALWCQLAASSGCSEMHFLLLILFFFCYFFVCLFVCCFSLGFLVA